MAHLIRNREGSDQKSCKDKVSLYLKGVVGMRPMVDMNSYRSTVHGIYSSHCSSHLMV